jgi:hypothetical protein
VGCAVRVSDAKTLPVQTLFIILILIFSVTISYYLPYNLYPVTRMLFLL